jgi:hypothetical protein
MYGSKDQFSLLALTLFVFLGRSRPLASLFA